MITDTCEYPSAEAFLSQATKGMFSREGVQSIDARTKSTDGDTALHIAALWGETSAVRQLLEAGAFVDKPGAMGRSPLYYAVLKGHASAAEHLLAHGGDPDLPSELGLSPREIAHKLHDARMSELFADYAPKG